MDEHEYRKGDPVRILRDLPFGWRDGKHFNRNIRYYEGECILLGEGEAHQLGTLNIEPIEPEVYDRYCQQAPHRMFICGFWRRMSLLRHQVWRKVEPFSAVTLFAVLVGILVWLWKTQSPLG